MPPSPAEPSLSPFTHSAVPTGTLPLTPSLQSCPTCVPAGQVCRTSRSHREHMDIWSCLSMLPLLSPLPQGQHKPFSRVTIPQDFLSPVSGMWPSATRRARGIVADLAAGSQLRVPMVSRAWCGLLCPAVLVPQTRHCPRSSQLSQCIGRGPASPHPPTTTQTAPCPYARISGPGPSQAGCRTLAWKWS